MYLSLRPIIPRPAVERTCARTSAGYHLRTPERAVQPTDQAGLPRVLRCGNGVFNRASGRLRGQGPTAAAEPAGSSPRLLLPEGRTASSCEPRRRRVPVFFAILLFLLAALRRSEIARFLPPPRSESAAATDTDCAKGHFQ